MSNEGLGENAQGTVSDPSVISAKADPVVQAVTHTETAKAEEAVAKAYDETYVKGLRTESAKYRTERNDLKAQLDEYAAKVKEFEDAKLSSDEKLMRDFEETRTKADTYRKQAEDASLALQLALAAQKENIADVKAAVRLADRAKVQFGDNGDVLNIGDVIADLKSEYASLFNQATSSAPNTGVTNPAKTPGKKKYTREDLQALQASGNHDEIARLYASGDLNGLMGR